nr:uncharacterized protein LOC117686510 [Crassostrea gigas]
MAILTTLHQICALNDLTSIRNNLDGLGLRVLSDRCSSMYQIRYETQSKLDLHQSSELILRKMSNLEVKLEKQDSRTEKKEALFRRMPSLRDLASECSSADVQDVILPSAIGRGLCRDEPLTDSGKKLQLMKMLCLTVLPVLGVWSYSVYMLSDTITIRSENEMASTDWFD